MFKYSSVFVLTNLIPGPASSDVSNRESAEFKIAETEYRHILCNKRRTWILEYLLQKACSVKAFLVSHSSLNPISKIQQYHKVYYEGIEYTLLEKISGTIFQTAVILEPFDLGP